LPFVPLLARETALPSSAKHSDPVKPLQTSAEDRRTFLYLMLAALGRSQKSTARRRKAQRRRKPFKKAIKARRQFATSQQGARFFAACECRSHSICTEFSLDTILTRT
jgi:hypothetical protein